MDPAPIERSFPADLVSRIAGAEGHARRSRRPVYSIHKWWARRPGAAFRAILLHALWDRPGDPWASFGEDPDPPLDRLVVDPFMGGGTTIAEALRLGCRVVGQDLSPVAWFVARKTVDPVDPARVREAHEAIRARLEPDVAPVYEARCPGCDGTARMLHAFWVKAIDCPACGEAFDLFKRHAAVEEHGSRNRRHLLVCPDCGDLVPADAASSRVECPCGRRFHGTDDAPCRRGWATCPGCAEEVRLIDRIAEAGRPTERIYLIEVLCAECGKSYRPVEEADRRAFAEASRRLRAEEADLPIPDQAIPEGVKTREILNHGYRRWRDLFTDRQLWVLGRLLAEIRDLEDRPVREMLVCALSDALHYNNGLVPYNRPRNHIELLFRHHAFHPKTSFTEGHVPGLELGRGSFRKCVRKVLRAKAFCADPAETVLAPDEASEPLWKRGFEKRSTERAIAARLVDDPADLEAPGDALIRCAPAERLPLADGTVDAVVTDPPYYDNVMYAELSDFFYVWLREGLGADPPFEAPLAPREAETVCDPSRGKDDDAYVTGLRDAFREAARVLKPRGLVCFTYHHQAERAWRTMIEAVLGAGLRPTAVHPIRTAMSGSPHVHRRDAVHHDLVICCRPTDAVPAEPASWPDLLAEAEGEARATLDDLRPLGPIGPADAVAFVSGVGLVLYGRHHPDVTDGDGDEVDPPRASTELAELGKRLGEELLEEAEARAS